MSVLFSPLATRYTTTNYGEYRRKPSIVHGHESQSVARGMRAQDVASRMYDGSRDATRRFFLPAIPYREARPTPGRRPHAARHDKRSNFTSLSLNLKSTRCTRIQFFLFQHQKLDLLTMACSVSDAPSLKDLPKVATDLKSQLEGFNTSCLRDVDTNEKIVLPSAEDVAAEKTQKSLFDGIEKFDASRLKHTETQEKNPLPDKDVVAAEKAHQNLLDGVEHFDKSQMKHATTEEKNTLPPIEAIEAEKEKNKFLNGIENFDPTKLKHTETCEKNPLPTKDIIEQEKTA